MGKRKRTAEEDGPDGALSSKKPKLPAIPTTGAVAFPNLMARNIAELLHSITCRWNHTDGCSFYMDKWGDLRSPAIDRPGSYSWDDHKHAYKAALRIIASVPEVSVSSLKKIIKMLCKYDGC